MGDDIRFRLTSGRGRVNSFSGQFATNSSSDPVAANERNTARATVKHSATGKYTVTFLDGYYDVYGMRADLNMGTADGSYAQVDSFAGNPTTGAAVMTIGVYKGSDNTALDLAAATGNVVSWSCQVRK